jgi:hypothetical protein
VIAALLSGIADACIRAINAVIEDLGSILQTLFDSLPDLPALPEPPAAFDMIYGWVAWVIPVDTIIDVLTFTLSVYLFWQGVAIALRWAKATSS